MKLKYLSAVWDRQIIPVPGNTIGYILYTTNNTSGRRTQFIFDVDNQVTLLSTIKGVDELTEDDDGIIAPGQEVISTYEYVPLNDKDLYIQKSIKPSIIYVKPNLYMQTIVVNSGTITPIKLDDGFFYNDKKLNYSKGEVILKITKSNDNIKIDDKSGSITLLSNKNQGVYEVQFIISDKNEPSIFAEGLVSITISK